MVEFILSAFWLKVSIWDTYFSTTYIKNEKFRTTLISDADGICGIRNFIHPDLYETDQNRVLTSIIHYIFASDFFWKCWEYFTKAYNFEV